MISREAGVSEEVWDDYMQWYYHSYVWKSVYYHGVRTLKLVSDMWNYQEIIFEHRIDHVIETGTRHGGSALFFADTLQARNAKGGVISVDIDASSNQVIDDPRIRFMIGDSGSEKLAAGIMASLPPDRGTLFLILDSDHTKDHVLKELRAFVPLLKRGDYLVVEDTNINGHPVRPDFGPGPWEAVQQYLMENPGFLRHDVSRERKFGATAAPDGYYVRL